MDTGLIRNAFGVPMDSFTRFVEHFGRTTAELEQFGQTLPRVYFKNGEFSINRTKGADRENRDDFIKRFCLFLYDFRVHPLEDRIVYYKKHSEKSYHQASDEVLAREINILWEFFFQCTPTDEVDKCVKNVLRCVTEKADIRNRVFRLTDGLFYMPDDKESLVSILPEGKECFFTLEGVYNLLNGSKEMTSLLVDSYNNFLGLLNSPEHEGLQFRDFYEDLPRDFDWVSLWADEQKEGYVDRYWDIMVAYSTPFHKNLVKKTYIFDGPTRTGKSSCRDLLVHLFGIDQVAEVRVPDYCNYHVNNKLAYCCINSPDEEKGGAVSKESCANFKTLATKGSVMLAVKNKQPIMADGQFMSFHPSNSNIEWPDTESSPCMKRCLVIKFFNDLSRFDEKPNFNFIQSTFVEHPENMAKFLGQVFALASYFSTSGKEFFISQSMVEANEYMSVETNSLDLYYKSFFTYFDGVTNENFLWEDYQYACYEFGWTQQNKSALRQRFGVLLMNKPIPRKIGTKSVRYVRHPKFSQPQVLYPDYAIHVLDSFAQKDTTPYGTAENMHDCKQSVVATLMRMEEQRKAEEEARRAEKAQTEFDLEA